jgi:hypothetical protein
MGSHAITYAVVALGIAAACLLAGFVWGRSNVKAQVEEAVEKEHVALDAREFAMRTQLEDAIAEIAKLRPLAEDLGRVQKRLEREQAKYAEMKAEFNVTMGISAEASAQENSESEPQSAPTRESADEAIQKLLQSLEVLNDPNAPADVDPMVAQSSGAALPTPAPPKVVAATSAPKPPVPVAQTAASQESRVHKDLPKPAEPARAIAETRSAGTPGLRKPLPAESPSPKIAAAPPAAPPRSSMPQSPIPQPQKVAPPQPRMPISNMPGKPPGTEPVKPGQQVDEWQEFARQLDALTGKKK